MKQVVISLAVFGLLAGCDRVKPDDRICSTPPEMAPGAWGDCIHKWSYRLSRAQGPNLEIAKAAVAACADVIVFKVNQADPEDRLQLLEDINRSAPETALFRVVQARAGHCDIPE
jgi:hypothetical protein